MDIFKKLTKDSVSELLITKRFFSHSLFQTCQACGVWSTFRDFSGELSRSSANTPGWCTEGTMSESLNWIASFSSLDSSVPVLLLNCSSGPSSALSAWMIWCWKCSVRLYKGIYGPHKCSSPWSDKESWAKECNIAFNKLSYYFYMPCIVFLYSIKEKL